MAILKWGKPSLFQKAPANTPCDSTDLVYALTADTSIVADKDYYTKSGETYTKVDSPQAADIATYYEGKPVWQDIEMPKEGTLQINTSDGQETVANEEGGDIVDVHYGKANNDITWDEYDKKDVPPTFEDNEGIVPEEYAIRLLPEDDSIPGFYIPRIKFRVTLTYNVADGAMRKNSGKILKPKAGKSLQAFSKPDNG